MLERLSRDLNASDPAIQKRGSLRAFHTVLLCLALPGLPLGLLYWLSRPAPYPLWAALGLAGLGAALGLAFQVVDDILDVTQDSTMLGKTAGKDAAHDKPTYISLMGLAAAQAHAQELHAQALAGLQASGLADTQWLKALADLVLQRKN